MRGNWWKIARLELTLAMRDRESLLWSLVAPIVMAWMFGSMFGGNEPPKPTRVRLDAGINPAEVARGAASYLERRGFELADDGVRVELPDSLLERIDGGRKVEARVVQGDAASLRARAVAATVREFMYSMAFHPRADSGSLLHDAPPTLDIMAVRRGAAPRVVTGQERTLPAMLIMFIMFQVMTFFMSLWIDDLRSGKIKRIVMSPSTPRDLLLGEVAARLAWASLQVVVILGVGSLVMGVRLDVDWMNFALVVLAFMLAAASIGMLAASFFRSSEKAGAMGVIISLVLAALGGCWWPLEIVPAAMRAVAFALPTGQAMSAIGEMLAVGPSAPFPATAVAVLILMALVALPIAARRMRSQLMQ
jgi:ABC-type transport system involved in cytochrome c biogenesis permease component